MNKYQFYANLVLLFHALILLFILACLPLVILYPTFRIVPLILIILTIVQWRLMGSVCIFTKIENKLRAKHDARTVYQQGCIVHYLHRWFGLSVTGRQVDIFLYSYFALIICFAYIIK